MRWNLAVGDSRERLEGLRRRGQRVAILDNEPELFPDLLPIWSAFAKLSAGRPIGPAGPCGLPAGEIVAYLEFIGIEGTEDRMDFFHLIRALDNEFIAWQGKQQHGNDRTTGSGNPKRSGAR